MRTGHQEHERKFDGAGGAELPALDGLPGVAQITDVEPEDLDAVYYDTADLRLLAHGVTLRRRSGGHDAGWHLKLPAGTDLRTEIQLPLSAGTPGRVPRELVLRTRAGARGGKLAPVVRLRTHRRRVLLLDDRGRPLAEIARDAVSAQVLNPARRPGDPLVPAQRAAGQHSAPGAGHGGDTAWTEVEAELLAGGTALLDAVEQRFVRAGLHRSASPSKLARALGRPGTAETGTRAEPRPGSIGAAVTALLREQTAELLALDPAVRADEPDATHRMRVAARRLRSTLRTHRRLLPDEPAGTLVAELRQLGADLGEARDQEVLGARLLAQIDLLTPEECPGPVRDRVAARSALAYRSSWKRAGAALDSPRYYALLDAVEDFAAEPAPRRRARRPAVAAFERMAIREQRRVDRRIAEAVAAPAGPGRDLAMHSARKSAKQARYAGEGAVSAVGRPAARFARRMRAVQELLGERQDALLACAALPELARTAQLAGEPGFGYGVLFAGQLAAIAQVDRELPAAWRSACNPRLAHFR